MIAWSVTFGEMYLLSKLPRRWAQSNRRRRTDMYVKAKNDSKDDHLKTEILSKMRELEMTKLPEIFFCQVQRTASQSRYVRVRCPTVVRRTAVVRDRCPPSSDNWGLSYVVSSCDCCVRWSESRSFLGVFLTSSYGTWEIPFHPSELSAADPQSLLRAHAIFVG